MTSSNFSDAQNKLLVEAREFGASELTDVGDDWRAAWAKVANFGILRALNQTDHGGQGLDVVSTVAMLDGLGQGCSDNGLTMYVAAQLFVIQETIRSFASETQKTKLLPGLGAGKLIGAYALTEADSGSEALALKTSAEKTDGGYVLNGAKTFIGMAPVADVFIVFASTSPQHKHWGLSVFLVHGTDQGLKRLNPQDTLGLRSMPMGGVEFEDCWIPEDRLIGSEGLGQSIFQHSMIWERSLILAGHVGSMARQLSSAADYAKSRQVAGKAVISHQSVANRLADMAVRLETCRLMQYRAASMIDENKAQQAFSAMTNLHISEAFLASSLDAVRTFGGKGYLSGLGPEQDLRDATGGVIYSGTSDIQRQIIANFL